MITITVNHIVTMRYSMKIGHELVENALESEPVSYLHGSNTILPILQKQLAGLQAGDKKTVYLYNAEGLTSEDLVFEVIIDEVRPASKQEIIQGYPQPTTNNCEGDCECYAERTRMIN